MNIFKKKCGVFIIGFVIGVFLAIFLFFIQDIRLFRIPTVRANYTYVLDVIPENKAYNLWLDKQNLERIEANLDGLSFGDNKKKWSKHLESELLFRNISLVCVIFVNKLSNAYAVSNTWTKRCNNVLYFGDINDKYLSVVRVKAKSQWQMLCTAIRYTYYSFGKKLQWALFAPDDLFVIPENLRYYLSTKDYRQALYIGHNSKFWNQIYNTNNGGYVLSKATFEIFLRRFNTSKSCGETGRFFKNEDYLLGKHLLNLGIAASDARDEFNRERFHLFTPEQLIAPDNYEVLLKYSKKSLHPVIQGFNCCSRTTISFQGTEKDLIYFYDYLLYKVKVFSGGHLGNNLSRVYVPSDDVWKKFVSQKLGDKIDLDQITKDDYYKMWTIEVSSPEKFNENIRKLHFNFSYEFN